MLLKQICTTALLSMVLLPAAHAGMYAWSAPGDGKMYSWGAPPNGMPPQVQTWSSPDGSASGWSYSTPGYSMWAYPPAAGYVPQVYSWSAPMHYPQGYYFYYPMYPGGGMYFYQAPPVAPHR